MPIGPYKDFGECVGAQQRKGKSEDSAKRICGELQKRVEGASIVDEEEFEYYEDALTRGERPDSDFAYVPEEAKGKDGKKSARKFPIYDAAHVRNALARFNQADLPSGAKSAVKGKICAAAKRFKVDSEVCSARNASSTETQFYDPKNDKLYLKIFLLDGSVNLNQWGVVPTSIPRNIKTAIGKPLVLYKREDGKFDHPSLNDRDLDHALAYQDLFRIGTYIDVVEDPNKRDRWWGIAEITDDNVKRAIREDPKIPFYVSPTIRVLHPYQSDESLEDWAFMHTAIVSDPAYTAQKAYIGGQCNGTANQCLLQLRRASIEKNGGNVGCGFCTYEAIKSLQENSRSKTVSSLVSSNLQNSLDNFRMSESNNTNSNNQQIQQSVAPSTANVIETPAIPAQTKQEEQQQQQPKAQSTEVAREEVKQQPVVTPEKVELENNNTNTKGTGQELVDTIQRQASIIKDLELRLKTAQSDSETLKSINSQYHDRIAKLEEHVATEQKNARLKAITHLVQSSQLYASLPAEEKQKQIDMFANGSMSEEQIRSFIHPLEASFVSASRNGYSPRLLLGENKPRTTSTSNNTEKVVEVKNASKITSNNSAEDGIPSYMKIGSLMRSKSTENGGIA